MGVTIKQIEAKPATYPAIDCPPEVIRGAPDAVELNLNHVWERIEAYIAYRWTTRLVTWHVEGPGAWQPPLAPAVINTVEIWDAGGWAETVEYGPSPCGGLFFPGAGPYRVIAVVGANAGALPASVMEAARRMLAYTASELPRFLRLSRANGAVSFWQGQALQASGAADLLRPYRRAH